MTESAETPVSPSSLPVLPPQPPPAATGQKLLTLRREPARKSEPSKPDRWHDVLI